MNILPEIGTTAPQFSLPDQNGIEQSLASFLGHWVLLYFYPKDDTPGCTKEACVIRDAFPDFDAGKVKVLGISADSVKSHKKFEEKYNLPFTLLADEGAQVARTYGVFGLKKFMGREHEGINRTSFLISADGKIAKVYEKVKPEVHAAEVLADLKTLNV
ncbi:MAG: alkyl hydroperoxide reductase/Thiol specific antioxidant/Mal allergen [Parcubacteria group bacterium]|nr:alkyl hydroperoxide reductase/Thiol specific antioxidant/Mal allergen [Parcubacteria group bacterium]